MNKKEQKTQLEYKDNLNKSQITETSQARQVDLRELSDSDFTIKRTRTQKVIPQPGVDDDKITYTILSQTTLSHSLLILLRNPMIKNNSQFQPIFLEGIRQQIKYMKTQKQFIKYLIYVHLILAQIESLNEQFIPFQGKQRLPELSKWWNTTNIINANCILNNVSQLGEQNVEKLQYRYIPSVFSIKIVEEDNVYLVWQNNIKISLNFVKKSLQSNGFWDIYFGPFLLSKLDFQGVFRCFSTCKDLEVTQTNYAKTFIELVQESKPLVNSQQWYNTQVTKILAGQCDYTEIRNAIANRHHEQYLEKLLIGLLGWDTECEEAVKLINMFYDGTDWQIRSPFHPTIAQCQQNFLINYLIENTKQHRQNLVVCVKAPCFNENYQQECFSWLHPKLIEYICDDTTFLWVQLDMGAFPKSGFYDWKMFMYRQSGKNEGVNKILNISQNKKYGSQIFHKKIHNIKRVQGRFIVHPKNTRKLQMHEIYMDTIQNKNPEGIPNFDNAAEEIQKVVKFGVNCVYLMGTFERDTGEFGQEIIKYKRPQASPLALTCRQTPCGMFGGSQKFLQVIQKARKAGVHILADCTTRVSSSRMSKKYNDLKLSYLDETGKKQTYFGADGRSINFEDTLILNYRKKQAWDLLLSEIVEVVQKYGNSGIYLDNGFSWPQMFEINLAELTRKDVDKTDAYSQKQIFEGEVINKSKKAGFWATQAKNQYPNPFLIQICKRLWKRYPNFLIVSQGFENSQQDDKSVSAIISGTIPRIFKMNQALSQIMGLKLHENGSISKTSQKTIVTLKKWYENVKKATPKNSIIIQSTTSHTWPYPSYIYKQATWAFIDLFFFLPQIPMTFIGEFNGRVYRTNATTIFISIQKQTKDANRQGDKGLKKIHSSFFNDPENNTNQQSLMKGVNHTVRDPSQIKHLQESFRKEVGPQFGFDLNFIHKHFQHRSKLRNQIPLLTSGQMISVNAEHMYGIHTNVLSFAKWNQKEILLISVNFNPAAIDMHYNLTNLKYLFSNPTRSTKVVRVTDLLNEKFEEQYYIVSELINSRMELHIEKYQSSIWKLFICEDQYLEKAYESSSKRVAKTLTQSPAKWIYSSIVTNQLIYIVSNTKNVDSFMEGLSLIYQKLIKPYNIDFNLLISKTHEFWVNKQKISKLFALFQLLKDYPHFHQVLKKSINVILEGNKLGPIVFVTPEIGVWSSVGGLGVMVDELSKELARLGEQVYVVTPYYEYNKKRETNYLLKDGFAYEQNIKTYAAHFMYQFGVHRGKYHGVNYVWLHNPQLFSKPYEGQEPLYVSKQLIFFALAVLQSFCQLKIFPSLVVTNDWMCGFVSAYVKAKKYKDIFDGTKFMHIVHNLDPLYEGRLYPKFQEGDLNWLYQLPRQWYIEYRSNKLVINPSKCALETCDNWGTVSNSYKYDLLKESDLSSVLWKHPNPFSFPNGVRKDERMHIIQTKTPGNHLDSKKLLQQKYFGFQEINNDMPLFAFIGRVTKQKGVHLIVDSIESLLYDYNFKIQFLIGGPSDSKEEYGKYCASRMKYLTNKYPKCVWSNPDAFFTEGPLVNIGSDFSMMPSLFEPGGIVQHQFFAGGTPVVAFRTGGLKDTVFQFDPKTGKGNGFNFMSYELEDFKNCLRRAIDCYKNKKNYQIIRKNAFDSVVEEEDVAKAWNNEFYRLQNKIYVEFDRVNAQIEAFKKAKENSDSSMKVLTDCPGQFWNKQWQTIKDFREVLNGAARLKATSHTFTYESTKVPRPKDIFIVGSWDQWQSKQKLYFNQLQKNWTITLKLKPGSYYYKYNVDGEWALTTNEEVEVDIHNNENHKVLID